MSSLPHVSDIFVTERRCSDLGYASVLGANRLYDTDRIDHQLSYKRHLHDNGGARRLPTFQVLSRQGGGQSLLVGIQY